MRELPKEIAERIVLEPISKTDPTLRITKIRPLEPCACGAELDDTRVVRIQKNNSPFDHWREYCYTCKRVSLLDENNWKNTHELNQEMRCADFPRDKYNC